MRVADLFPSAERPPFYGGKPERNRPWKAFPRCAEACAGCRRSTGISSPWFLHMGSFSWIWTAFGVIFRNSPGWLRTGIRKASGRPPPCTQGNCWHPRLTNGRRNMLAGWRSVFLRSATAWPPAIGNRERKS